LAGKNTKQFGILFNFFLLDKKEAKHQGCVGYVAADCEASIARIGAVSLPQSAWIKQNEQFYQCFAARCHRILQGRPSHAQGQFVLRYHPCAVRNISPFCLKNRF